MIQVATCPDCGYTSELSVNGNTDMALTLNMLDSERNYRELTVTRSLHDCRRELHTDQTSMQNFEKSYRDFVLAMPRAEVTVRYAQAFGNTPTWRELRSIPNRVDTSDELINACLDMDINEPFNSLIFITDFTEHMERNA